APRTIWAGASTAYWKAAGARQVDAPILMVAAGVTRGVQIGGSVPIYHFRDQSGLADSGVGTVSMYGKVRLIDPAVSRRAGLAIAPLVEVTPGASTGRVGWALPVNVEARAERFRVYGSAGYFSRGSIFGSAAIEVPAGRRASVTGNFGQSHASGTHQTSVGLGLSFAPA